MSLILRRLQTWAPLPPQNQNKYTRDSDWPSRSPWAGRTCPQWRPAPGRRGGRLRPCGGDLCGAPRPQRRRAPGAEQRTGRLGSSTWGLRVEGHPSHRDGGLRVKGPYRELTLNRPSHHLVAGIMCRALLNLAQPGAKMRALPPESESRLPFC